MKDLEKNLNALLIFILCGVLIGGFWMQFIKHEKPCPLCLLQRIGMISVATAATLNLWLGVRIFHYGIALISAVMGGSIALRQIALHVCPGMPKFGEPVFGISLYTWSFFVFVSSILYVAMLLLVHNPEDAKENRPVNVFGKCATFLILSIVILNCVATLAQCGIYTCETK